MRWPVRVVAAEVGRAEPRVLVIANMLIALAATPNPAASRRATRATIRLRLLGIRPPPLLPATSSLPGPYPQPPTAPSPSAPSNSASPPACAPSQGGLPPLPPSPPHLLVR